MLEFIFSIDFRFFVVNLSRPDGAFNRLKGHPVSVHGFLTSLSQSEPPLPSLCSRFVLAATGVWRVGGGTGSHQSSGILLTWSNPPWDNGIPEGSRLKPVFFGGQVYKEEAAAETGTNYRCLFAQKTEKSRKNLSLNDFLSSPPGLQAK